MWVKKMRKNRENTNAGTLMKLPVSITIAGILIFIGVLLIILYLSIPTIRDDLTFITIVAGGLTVIYSAFYVAANLRISIKRDMLKSGFEIIQEIHGSHLSKIRVFLERNIAHGRTPPDEFYQIVTNDTEMEEYIRSLLCYFEEVSIAIQCDLADEAMMYMHLTHLLPWAGQAFAPYIIELRQINNDDRIFIELEKLADAWKHGISIKSGKPFPVI